MTALKVIEKLGGAPHSKLSLRLWLRLLSCSMVIEKRIRQKLADEFDTTLPRFDVLAALDRNPEGLTMSELSNWLLVSAGNVTSIVTRLIDDGLIERLADGGDRRVIRVKLTAPGQTRFDEMARGHEGWVDHLMADLGESEINALLDGLDAVRRSIERNRI